MELEIQINSVSELLLQLTYEELGAVAGHVKVSEEQISKARTRRHLLTAINKRMDELGDSEEEDIMWTFLKNLKSKFTN